MGNNRWKKEMSRIAGIVLVLITIMLNITDYVSASMIKIDGSREYSYEISDYNYKLKLRT